MYLSSICLSSITCIFAFVPHTLKKDTLKSSSDSKITDFLCINFCEKKNCKKQAEKQQERKQEDQHFCILITILENQSKMSLINMFSILQF